jgi:DNA adenine methylase
MAGLLRDIRKLNGLGDRSIAEPFAGGAGACLALLYLEEASRIHINDADPAIYDFWWTLTNRSKPFLNMLLKTRVNIREWRKQRAVFRNPRSVARLRRGFATFFLNRCNRSGIILTGGPIGGIKQTGRWKIDADATVGHQKHPAGRKTTHPPRCVRRRPKFQLQASSFQPPEPNRKSGIRISPNP